MGPQVKRQRKSKEPGVAKNVKTYVKKCMDRIVEDKRYLNSNSINTVVGGAIVDFGLWGIQQGVGLAQRTGNYIRLKEFQIRFSVNNDPTNIIRQRVRVLIVQDNQCNGALPAVLDVLANNVPTSVYQYNNVIGCGGSRFKILKDWTYDFKLMPISTTSAGVSRTVSWKFKKGLPAIQYDASAGAIGDLVSKNIFMLVIGDDNDQSMDYNFLFCYQDA